MFQLSSALVAPPHGLSLDDTWIEAAVLVSQSVSALAEGDPLPVGLLGELLLYDKGRVVGVLTPLQLLRGMVSGLNPVEATLRELAARDASMLLPHLPVVEVNEGDSRQRLRLIWMAATLMQRHQLGTVPVLDPSGQALGALTPFSVLQLLQPPELLRLFSLSAVAASAVMIEGDPSVEQMVESGQRWLMVGDPGRPDQVRDILSDRRLLSHRMGQGSGLRPPPIILKPSQGAHYAYEKLLQEGRSALCLATPSGPKIVNLITLLQVLEPTRLFSGLQSAQLLINRLQAERDPLVWQRDPPPSLPPTPVRGAGFEDPPSLPDFGNRIQEREQLKRRWAEEALRKSERLRLTMLSHVPAVIWIVDAQLHFTHVVGGDPVNIGLSEDLVGRHVGDLDPEQLPQMQAEYHRRALAGERVIYELPLGSETIYECRLDPLPEGKGVIGIAINISARKRAEAKMTYLAHYDALTGLPNRVVFNQHLRQKLIEAQGNGSQVAVMFLDLDAFKNINDTLGHTVGDQLLQEVARRLKGCLREQDLIARMGGDEFTFILADLEQSEDAERVAQRILAALTEPIILAYHSLYVSGSIGISIYPRDGQDLDSLVRRADAAMYRAKSQGHGVIETYTPSIESHTLENLLLENQLRQALSEDQGLLLYYQPLVCLHSDQMIGVEALLRWRTPEGDCLAPGDVVKAAEDSGLIGPLGRWILKSACHQAQIWRNQGSPHFQLAVNLSFRQFIQRDLVEQIAQVLEETQFPPNLLELHLTESVSIQDMDWVVQVLQKLSQMGIQLALDNFGKGHATLLHLRELPLNQLRLDRGFTENIDAEDPQLAQRDQALVRATVELGHSLGLHVSANGIERAEQLRILRELGCDEAQGHYFSPPLDVENMTRLLEDPSGLST